MKHTRPPFKLGKSRDPVVILDAAGKYGVIAICSPQKAPMLNLTQEEHDAITLSNAAFIVRACNCFDELLGALRDAPQPPPDGDDLTNWFGDYEIWHRETRRAIIAKAEGK